MTAVVLLAIMQTGWEKNVIFGATAATTVHAHNYSGVGASNHTRQKLDQMDTFWDVEKYKEIGRNSLLQEKIMKFIFF